MASPSLQRPQKPFQDISLLFNYERRNGKGFVKWGKFYSRTPLPSQVSTYKLLSKSTFNFKSSIQNFFHPTLSFSLLSMGCDLDHSLLHLKLVPDSIASNVRRPPAIGPCLRHCFPLASSITSLPSPPMPDLKSLQHLSFSS